MDYPLLVAAIIYGGGSFVAGFWFREWWSRWRAPTVTPAQVRSDIEAFFTVSCGPANGKCRAESDAWKKNYYGCPIWELGVVTVLLGRTSVLFCKETPTQYETLRRIEYTGKDALDSTVEMFKTFDPSLFARK